LIVDLNMRRAAGTSDVGRKGIADDAARRAGDGEPGVVANGGKGADEAGGGGEDGGKRVAAADGAFGPGSGIDKHIRQLVHVAGPGIRDIDILGAIRGDAVGENEIIRQGNGRPGGKGLRGDGGDGGLGIIEIIRTIHGDTKRQIQAGEKRDEAGVTRRGLFDGVSGGVGDIQIAGDIHGHALGRAFVGRDSDQAAAAGGQL
jgi:hypothetical protein